MSNSGRDMRQAPRFTTRIFGVFSRDFDLDETEVLMANMSQGGAFVRSETPAPPGTPIMLRIYLDPKGTPLSVGCEVVWWRTPGQGPTPGMGVKFNQVGPGDLERIKGFLASLVEADLFGS